MQITPIKTVRVTTDNIDLLALLDASLKNLQEGDVLAITSKIVSLCEGSTVPMDGTDKEDLISRAAHLRLPRTLSNYGIAFTITNDTLIPSAGIDESNGGDHYILWPKDAQQTANTVRKYLAGRFGLTNLGIVITDSTCQPLRRGTVGIVLAHSGFQSLNDYIGKPDLFNRPFKVSQSNVAGGLAASAVIAMGEGAEQTPLCVMSDLPFVQFQDHDPTAEELAMLRIPLEDDLFAPFLEAVDWIPGDKT